MAIIRLISMNDKKYEFGDEHEYQQLQSGSNSSSERNSYVSSLFLTSFAFPIRISVRIIAKVPLIWKLVWIIVKKFIKSTKWTLKFRGHLLRVALTPAPSGIPMQVSFF